MNFLQNNSYGYFVIFFSELKRIWQEVVQDLLVPILVTVDVVKYMIFLLFYPSYIFAIFLSLFFWNFNRFLVNKLYIFLISLNFKRWEGLSHEIVQIKIFLIGFEFLILNFG